jgi:ADP-heptose:LPS heptosyltransferase
LAAAVPAERRQVARSLPLAELARRLQSCVAFVGHDSGISHLAAALGRPCLILWGDALEEIWRPQGEQVVILRELNGVGAISVKKVMDELHKLNGVLKTRKHP